MSHARTGRHWKWVFLPTCFQAIVGTQMAEESQAVDLTSYQLAQTHLKGRTLAKLFGSEPR